MISLDELRANLAIDPVTGHLMWLRGTHKGKLAGHYVRGKRRVRIKYFTVDEGDAVIALKTGEWPTPPPVPAPKVRSRSKPKARARAKSPHPYIILMVDGRYKASAPFMGKAKHLGLFDTLEAARDAQDKFALQYQQG